MILNTKKQLYLKKKNSGLRYKFAKKNKYNKIIENRILTNFGLNYYDKSE